MGTLYIRDIPADVSDTLKKRAAQRGQSLSAYVATELTKIASRPTNEEVVARLRTVDRAGSPTRPEILKAVEAGRH